MSLRIFHVIFIAVCISLSVWVAIWGVREFAASRSWNALLLDDLFDTGATMDAVCRTLRTYKKIDRVYAASITWK